MSIKLAGWCICLAAGIQLAGPAALGTTYYWGGGSADIANGTPLPTALQNLNGTWNSTTKNWATDSLGTTYTNWNNTATDNIAVFATGVVSSASNASVTQGEDLVVNTLKFLPIANGYNWELVLRATSARKLTLNGTSPNFDVPGGYNSYITIDKNVLLEGASGLTRPLYGAGGYVNIYSPSINLTGVLNVSDGKAFTINGVSPNDGRLTGISRFDCVLPPSPAVSLFSLSLGTGIQDRIADTVDIYLKGGNFGVASYRGASSSQETINRLVLSTAGVLELTSTSGGTGTRGQLILGNATAGIDRGVDNKGVLVVVVDDTYTAPQTDVVVQNGFATGVILPWAATQKCQPIQLDASKVITNVATVAAPQDLATWAAGNHYRVEGTFTPVNSIPTVSIKTLGLFHSDAASKTMTIGTGNTLTLSDGLLMTSRRAANTTVTLTGGKLTSGTSDLYILGGNDGNYASLIIESEITGPISLIKGGRAGVTLGGSVANTYTGTTYVMGNDLTFSKTGGAIGIPGNVVVGRGTLYAAGSQIATNATITIRNGGVLALGTSSQTFSETVTIEGGGELTWQNAGTGPRLEKTGTGLVLTGGTLRHNSSSSGPFLLYTDVSYPTDSLAQSSFRPSYSGSVDAVYLTLCTATATNNRTFNIGSSTNVTGGKAEVEITIPLAETSGGMAGITKTGAGTLAIRRPTFSLSGPCAVNGGRLVSAGSWHQVSRQGTIFNGNPIVTGLSRTDDLVVGQPVFGTGITAQALIASIDSATQITMTFNATANGTPTLNFVGGRTGMGKHQVLTGTTVNGLYTITGLSTTSGLIPRQPVSGSGVQGGNMIVSIDSTSQVTVLASSYASGTAAITFTGGSAVGRGPVTVNSSGTLMGDGVAGIVTNNSGGTIDAGVIPNSAATMQFGTNLVFMAGSTQQVDIASDTTNDQLQVFGNLTLAGAVNPSLLGGYNPSEGTWTIATYTGTATGSMTAPDRYLVTIDSGNKKILLAKRPASTGFIMGIY